MPLKTIAVPANPMARGPVAEEAPEPRVTSQRTHRYRVGDRLRLTSGGNSIQRLSGSCKVIALLPYEGHGILQYRIRNEAESFERVVSEGDLTRNGS